MQLLISTSQPLSDKKKTLKPNHYQSKKYKRINHTITYKLNDNAATDTKAKAVSDKKDTKAKPLSDKKIQEDKPTITYKLNDNAAY